MELRSLGKTFFVEILLIVCVHSRTIARTFEFPDAEQAKFVDSLSDYEVSVPVKITHQGELLSNNLHHVFPHSHVHKRSLKDFDHQNNVHYRLRVEGKELQLHMRPNHLMVSPGLVVERRIAKFGNVSDSKISWWRNDLCHYIGHVKEHPQSFAAIATCKGLTGIIRTNETEYFIEPVKGHNLVDNAHHPHLIYKRSAVASHLHNHEPHIHNKNERKGSMCGVKTERRNSVDIERERWERDMRRVQKTNQRRRHKRSVSKERHIETLVVADTKMVDYYKKEDIETYILTIMNMVSALYHDASVGNAINIVLVRLILLEKDEPELKITHHADRTLASFCKWQNTVNPPDEHHPNHHDVAILLTRKNICARMNEPCSTLGLAQVSGMCQPHRSCNINEDTGLSLAYTVAHELGHNLGMKHDDYKSDCSNPYDSPVKYIMAPMMEADSSSLVWSNCSRRSVTQFLDRDWGFCLDDDPTEYGRQFEFPVLPPGAMYDADHQCRLQYGHHAAYCDGIEDACSTLWCKVNNKCLTRLEPAAEGTMCGEGEWCYGSKCMTIGEHPQSPAIDGEWGQWGDWTSCSRTCGAGISQSQRHCDNPPPSNGGRYCLGERRRYRVCNTQECADGTSSFRQKQCEQFNYLPYKNGLYEWEAVPQPASPCQLHCKPRNRFFSVMLRDTVTDGTPCRPGSRDMCINGLCRRIGCDWGIDSGAREDRCGVCHGDGSTCTTIKQQFSEERGLGYVEASVIPKGARNIRVEEVAEANNYLAVKNEQGKYYLNGGWYIQWSGDYEAAGTVIHYNREGNKEKFIAPGPLKEPIHIMLLFQSQNPGVIFEYTVPKENATVVRTPEFQWRRLDWTHCTVSCGGGTKRAQVVCEEREDGIVEDKYCNKTSKPDDIIKPCNEHLCPARWWAGPWQHCSVTCGDNGLHKRTVICVRSKGPAEQIALDVSECDGMAKPSEIESCHRKQPCPGQAKWTVGEWSKTCTGDPCLERTRSVGCSDPQLGCDPRKKPMAQQNCANVTCGHWEASEWSVCTRTCGSGIQFRQVQCVGGSFCQKNTIPKSEQVCNTKKCDIIDNRVFHFMLGDEPAVPEDNSVHDSDNNEVDLISKHKHGKDVHKDTKPAAKGHKVNDHKTQPFKSSTVTGTSTSSVHTTNTVAAASTPKTNIVTLSSTSQTKTLSPESTTKMEKFTKPTGETNSAERTSVVYKESTIPQTNTPHSTKYAQTQAKKNTKQDYISNEIDDKFSKVSSANHKPFGISEQKTKQNLSLVTTNVSKHKQNKTMSTVTPKYLTKTPPVNTEEATARLTSLQKIIQPRTTTTGTTSTTPPPTTTTSTTTKTPHVYKWIHLFWQECSRHCGGGVRKRQLMCIEIKTYEDVDMSLCPAETKPVEAEACNTQPCLTWNVTSWSACSASCGGGSQHRRVTCPRPHHCNHDDRPAQRQQCNTEPCLSWVPGSWSQCTKSCGEGSQIRHVQCVDTTIQQPASGCHSRTKPATTQSCNTEPCQEQQAALSVDQKDDCLTNRMSYPVCKMLKRRGQCVHRYIKIQCCRTCSENQHRRNSPRHQLT